MVVPPPAAPPAPCAACIASPAFPAAAAAAAGPSAMPSLINHEHSFKASVFVHSVAPGATHLHAMVSKSMENISLHSLPEIFFFTAVMQS